MRAGSYRDEVGRPGSTTETFVALTLEVETWRWAGVPFYLRTGKAMARKVTEVTVQYRQPPLLLLEGEPPARPSLETNRLSVRIQPDERVALRFGLKPPGDGMSLASVIMDFDYRQGFGAGAPGSWAERRPLSRGRVVRAA